MPTDTGSVTRKFRSRMTRLLQMQRFLRCQKHSMLDLFEALGRGAGLSLCGVALNTAMFLATLTGSNIAGSRIFPIFNLTKTPALEFGTSQGSRATYTIALMASVRRSRQDDGLNSIFVLVSVSYTHLT